MRRLAILLVPMLSTLGAVVGTAATAAPAHAEGTPIASVSVIVNPPPQPAGLLSLCITSRSLDPGGTCINI